MRCPQGCPHGTCQCSTDNPSDSTADIYTPRPSDSASLSPFENEPPSGTQSPPQPNTEPPIPAADLSHFLLARSQLIQDGTLDSDAHDTSDSGEESEPLVEEPPEDYDTSNSEEETEPLEEEVSEDEVVLADSED